MPQEAQDPSESPLLWQQIQRLDDRLRKVEQALVDVASWRGQVEKYHNENQWWFKSIGIGVVMLLIGKLVEWIYVVSSGKVHP